MLYTFLSPVTSFFNKKRQAISDTKIFRLHTITTPALFLSFSMFYGLREYLGEAINCLGPSDMENKRTFANDYCWISSTYSIVEYFQMIDYSLPKYQHIATIYPGVGPYQYWNTKIYHKFYMWIPFYFVALAVLFYLPRYIWKHFECGHMKMLMEKLDTPIVEDEEVKTAKISLLTNYIHKTLGFNTFYALAFFGCEVLNFFVAIISCQVTDLLINHKFATYGPDVLRYWRGTGPQGSKSVNPMSTVFPKLTKCEVKFYGASGNVIPIDYICTMSLNNFNDKVFLFLWFYFVILVFTSGLAMVFRVAVVFCPKLRVLMLKKSLIKLRQYSSADKLSNLFVGDWFVIHQLAKNIDRLAYFDFLDLLSRKLEPDREILDVEV